MSAWRSESRRRFLWLAGGAGALVSADVVASTLPVVPDEEDEEEEVSPAEDLMREHGALDRILLIYDEAIARLDGHRDFDPSVVADSAGIVRRFVEDYHEKLEENELFPRFEKARVLVDLVGTQFNRMYRPHAAREDTVLFPALHRIVSSSEYDSLGEQFEDEEHRLFGEDGFEKVVDEVAGLEKRLGIHDLAQFTPKA
jgi:hemerythrin-like domain-containing protein